MGAKIKFKIHSRVIMASRKTSEREKRLDLAVKAADKGGKSLRVAGSRHDVPKSTVHDHLSGGLELEDQQYFQKRKNRL